MITNGRVVCICVGSEAGAVMAEVSAVTAKAGNGLVGDRYYGGNGSFNRDKPGKRQITLMNAMFF